MQNDEYGSVENPEFAMVLGLNHLLKGKHSARSWK